MIYGSDELLTLAVAYRAATGLPLSTLGRKVAGNPNLFTRLELGRTCRADSAEQATGWFVENWPAEAPWPKGVPR